MTAEQSYNVTLKLVHTDGIISSVRLLKSKSKLPEEILNKLNEILSKASSIKIHQPSIATQVQNVPQAPVVPQALSASQVPMVSQDSNYPQVTSMSPIVGASSIQVGGSQLSYHHQNDPIISLAQDAIMSQLRSLELMLEKSISVKSQSSASLGNLAEASILAHLRKIEKVNQDFSVSDTSSLTNHGDLSAFTQGSRVCIEVKNYSKPVPGKELDKFHNSVDLPDYSAGVIIQVNECGYARERNILGPIDIRVIKSKPIAYLTAPDYDLIYPIIITLVSLIKITSEDEDLSSQLELRTKKLLEVHDRAKEMKVCIESQKKSIAKMERLLADTLSITLVS